MITGAKIPLIPLKLEDSSETVMDTTPVRDASPPRVPQFDLSAINMDALKAAVNTANAVAPPILPSPAARYDPPRARYESNSPPMEENRFGTRNPHAPTPPRAHVSQSRSPPRYAPYRRSPPPNYRSGAHHAHHPQERPRYNDARGFDNRRFDHHRDRSPVNHRRSRSPPPARHHQSRYSPERAQPRTQYRDSRDSTNYRR